MKDKKFETNTLNILQILQKKKITVPLLKDSQIGKTITKILDKGDTPNESRCHRRARRFRSLRDDVAQDLAAH